jgi:thiamine biosynthesis protein ThiI
MDPCSPILLAYSEIGTKGKATRPKFERQLIQNVRATGAKFRVVREQGRILLQPVSEEDSELLKEKLGKVFGVQYYATVKEMEFRELEDLACKVAALYGELVKNKVFRVTVHRIGNHKFDSIDAQKLIGEKLLVHGGKVSLRKFELEVKVNIKDRKALVFDAPRPGPGGLPIGSEGNVLALFSGGIDSPVAAWYAMRRGCNPAFLFINLGGKDTLERVYAVYRKLAYLWGHGNFVFLVADGRQIVDEIKKLVKAEYRQVVLKRAFYNIAERVCRERKLDAIITGESIGQVSTQTLRNLWGIESASNVLFIRPLIGFDKEDSIRMAQKIGTYELSNLVGELCNISEGSVKLSAKPYQVDENYNLLGKVVDETNVTIVTQGQISEETPIPQNATVVDVDREKIDYAKLDKGAFYRVICKDGINASIECEMLRGLGFKCTSGKRSALSKQ